MRELPDAAPQPVPGSSKTAAAAGVEGDATADGAALAAAEPAKDSSEETAPAGTRTAVNIRLLDRDYRFAVTETERNDLLAAAAKLDARMRAIRDQGKILAPDRIAVMAALESSLDAHKLARASGGNPPASSTPQTLPSPPAMPELADDAALARLRALSERLETVLQMEPS